MWEWFDQVGYNVDLDALTRSYPEVGWQRFRPWTEAQDWTALDECGPVQPNA